MPLLNQILGRGGLGGIFGGGQPLALGLTRSPNGTPFKKTLQYTDFTGIATTDQTVTAGKWNTIGTYTVSSQQFATVGYGRINDHPENQGKVFIDTEDTSGTDIDGWIRIALANAQETQVVVVLEERTETLSLGESDTRQRLHMPEYPLWAGEDSKILIQFKPDSSGTVDSGETIIYIDATLYQ